MSTLEGDLHDRDGVRDRILKQWTGQQVDDAKELVEAVVEQASEQTSRTGGDPA
ncbi:MAG TPA: hypothetical protein VEK33_23120 [Terriglobales bacterium]|nr:hypothetical protein [Terriglobales bacterium]